MVTSFQINIKNHNCKTCLIFVDFIFNYFHLRRRLLFYTTQYSPVERLLWQMEDTMQDGEAVCRDTVVFWPDVEFATAARGGIDRKRLKKYF